MHITQTTTKISDGVDDSVVRGRSVNSLLLASLSFSAVYDRHRYARPSLLMIKELAVTIWVVLGLLGAPAYLPLSLLPPTPVCVCVCVCQCV